MADEATSAQEMAPPGGEAATPWRRRLAIAAVALAPALLLQAIAAASPTAVERAYAGGIYRPIIWTLNLLTAWMPFSLAELLLIGAIGTIAYRLARAAIAIRRGERRLAATAQRALSAAIVAAAFLYAAFVITWGLNYRRPPFAVTAGYDPAPPSVIELEALAHELVAEANRRRDDPRIVEDERGVMRAPDGARAALARAARGYAALAPAHPMVREAYGPPKPVLFSGVMSYLDTTGIFIPFTGEANVNVTAPHCRIPFIACHELAHQQGFASEDEASFVAYLVCRVHPDADYAYSGALMASSAVVGALLGADEAAAARAAIHRNAAVARDLAALRSWYEAYDTPLGQLANRVNDTYLKAQGKTDGVRSYGRMVDLLVAERRARSGR